MSIREHTARAVRCLAWGAVEGLIFVVYYIFWGDHKGGDWLDLCAALGIGAGGGAIVFGVPLFMLLVASTRCRTRGLRAGLACLVCLALSGSMWLVGLMIGSAAAGAVLAFCHTVAVFAPWVLSRAMGSLSLGLVCLLAGFGLWGASWAAWHALWAQGITFLLSDHLRFCPLGVIVLSLDLAAIKGMDAPEGTGEAPPHGR